MSGQNLKNIVCNAHLRKEKKTTLIMDRTGEVAGAKIAESVECFQSLTGVQVVTILARKKVFQRSSLVARVLRENHNAHQVVEGMRNWQCKIW